MQKGATVSVAGRAKLGQQQSSLWFWGARWVCILLQRERYSPPAPHKLLALPGSAHLLNRGENFSSEVSVSHAKVPPIVSLLCWGRKDAHTRVHLKISLYTAQNRDCCTRCYNLTTNGQCQKAGHSIESQEMQQSPEVCPCPTHIWRPGMFRRVHEICHTFTPYGLLGIEQTQQDLKETGIFNLRI